LIHCPKTCAYRSATADSHEKSPLKQRAFLLRETPVEQAYFCVITQAASFFASSALT
jgi:hypothetical protein